MTEIRSNYPSERVVDAGRLWAGGLATALVAALVAVAGIVVCRGVLDIAILVPLGHGAWGTASTAFYALAAAFAAIIATAIMHGLILSTPSPRKFYGWIIGLVTVIAAVTPFIPKTRLVEELATAIINVIIGVAIGTLVSSVARSAIRSARNKPANQYRGDQYRGDQYRGDQYRTNPY